MQTKTEKCEFEFEGLKVRLTIVTEHDPAGVSIADKRIADILASQLASIKGIA